MALGADRYASRGDTFAFLGCVLLSVAAMSLPERIRDPLARGLRQTVLAPFLALQQQTELLSASLARYDAVVGPEGLVGIVSSVDAKTSVVVSWAHPEFRASAMAADGSVYGIVAPHGSEGPRIWLLELQGVAYRQLVPTGTMILTSGLGGVLPRGIPIGTVLGVAGQAEGWERAYLIRPAVHPAAVTHVMILTGPPVRGDLRSLFESSGETPGGAVIIVASTGVSPLDSNSE